MKALISPVENNRIVQVELNEFPIAEPLYWIDCPDETVTNWLYSDGLASPPPVVSVEFTFMQKLSLVRLERDKRLSASDWTELPSVINSHDSLWIEAWETYRKALRDLPQTISNIDDVIYPTPPQ